VFFLFYIIIPSLAKRNFVKKYQIPPNVKLKLFKLQFYKVKFFAELFVKSDRDSKGEKPLVALRRVRNSMASKNAGKVNCIVDARGKPSSGVFLRIKTKANALAFAVAQSAAIAAGRHVLIL